MDQKQTSILLCLLVPLVTCAAESTSYHCGERFYRELQLPASVYWERVPLRDGLLRLSGARKVAIWLDRRAVPNKPVTCSVNELTLSRCLTDFATQTELDVAWTDCLIYVGPPGTAQRFATVNTLHGSMLAKLPQAKRDVWQRRRPMSWPALTTPEALLDSIQREVDLPIEGRQQVQHDLWRAGAWPAMPAYTRLGLLLAGFDLTFLWNGDGSAKIVPLPQRPTYEKSYPVRSPQKKTVRDLVATLPHTKLEFVSGRCRLRAGWAVHQAVELALNDASTRQRPAREIRYTVTSQNQPVGPVLEQLAKQFQLDLEFSAAARANYDQLVSFQVREGTREELLRAILSGADLRHELRGTVLRVLHRSE